MMTIEGNQMKMKKQQMEFDAKCTIWRGSFATDDAEVDANSLYAHTNTTSSYVFNFGSAANYECGPYET